MVSAPKSWGRNDYIPSVSLNIKRRNRKNAIDFWLECNELMTQVSVAKLQYLIAQTSRLSLLATNITTPWLQINNN